MADTYRPPKQGAAALNERFDKVWSAINSIRAAAGLTSAVIGKGGITTYDPDTGGRVFLGDGNIAVWDDFDTNPTGFGRIYCDPGSGLNYFRFFPPYMAGTGLENSLTIKGTTPDASGAIWLYSDGSINLFPDEQLYVGTPWIHLVASEGIDLTADNVKVHTGELGLYDLPTTGSAANLRLDTIGGVWTVGLVSSSLRYKQDVEDAPVDPADVLKMQGRTWRDKSAVAIDPDITQRHVGFIAEELDEIGLGIFVDYDEQGRPDAIQYDRVSVALVELAKTQQAQLDAQAAQIAALTARLDAAGIA